MTRLALALLLATLPACSLVFNGTEHQRNRGIRDGGGVDASAPIDAALDANGALDGGSDAEPPDGGRTRAVEVTVVDGPKVLDGEEVVVHALDGRVVRVATTPSDGPLVLDDVPAGGLISLRRSDAGSVTTYFGIPDRGDGTATVVRHAGPAGAATDVVVVGLGSPVVAGGSVVLSTGCGEVTRTAAEIAGEPNTPVGIDSPCFDAALAGSFVSVAEYDGANRLRGGASGLVTAGGGSVTFGPLDAPSAADFELSPAGGATEVRFSVVTWSGYRRVSTFDVVGSPDGAGIAGRVEYVRGLGVHELTAFVRTGTDRVRIASQFVSLPPPTPVGLIESDLLPLIDAPTVERRRVRWADIGTPHTYIEIVVNNDRGESWRGIAAEGVTEVEVPALPAGWPSFDTITFARVRVIDDPGLGDLLGVLARRVEPQVDGGRERTSESFVTF